MPYITLKNNGTCFTHQVQFGEILDRGRTPTTDLLHLGPDLILPLGVASEKHDRPREQQGGGLVEREEEGFALIHDQLQV